MNVREIRKKAGLTQIDFWKRIGVTQSGGSRYESGRNIPKPVQLLLDIAYGPERKAASVLNKVQGRVASTRT